MPERGDQSNRPSPGLTELIGKALTDEQFRNRLSGDWESVAEEFRLSETDREALESISVETLAEHAQRFTAGSAAAVTVAIAVKGEWYPSPLDPPPPPRDSGPEPKP